MNGTVRHEAAHAVVGWRSDLFEVQSITLTLDTHVRMVGGRKPWSLSMEDAVVHAVGPLAEDPAVYDDYGLPLTAWLFTDTHTVMAPCAQLGQRGERHGQEWWLRFVRDEALERLRLYADDIDRVEVALGDRGALDHDDLVVILGAQTPRNTTDSATSREERA